MLEAHVIGLRLPGRATVFGWWLLDYGDWNPSLLVDGRIAWWAREEEASETWPLLPDTHTAVRDPDDPVLCDAEGLADALADPADRHRGELLTTIDLLDDLQHQAEAILGGEPALERGVLCFTPVRNAFFDDATWEDAIERAGGAAHLRAALGVCLDRIVLASRLPA